MNRFPTRALAPLLTLAVAAMAAAAPAAFVPAPVRAARASSAPNDAAEFDVKAAFLFKLAYFTTWPDDAFEKPESPFVVAVVGADPFGAKLDATMKDKKILTHPIVVERYATAEKIGQPHLLFASGRDDDKLAAARIACRGKAILLVGDCADFCAKGGVANFFLEDGKVHFEMNPAAAKRARLSISSLLLRLAKIVEER
jgi:hypothetical protein